MDTVTFTEKVLMILLAILATLLLVIVLTKEPAFKNAIRQWQDCRYDCKTRSSQYTHEQTMDCLRFCDSCKQDYECWGKK